MRIHLCGLFLLSLLLFTCQNAPSAKGELRNEKSSLSDSEDDRAALCITKLMDAMGGEEKWNDLKYVSWTFFGSRHLVWDKVNNRVRIESPKDSSTYLINIDELSGRYAYNNSEILDEELLSEKIERGKSIWMNDMYWLFMPFKLKDEGVSVKYMRRDTTLKGEKSEVLQLTFSEVGDTPQNKYEIYVDQSDNLIKQWDFYEENTQNEPNRQWPWDNYNDFNGLLLSSNRSDNGGPSNVRVYEALDEKVFASFEEFAFY
ncbi:MAG: hypothetical protein AAF487_00530 [Bacteroidota bacterium]